MTVQIFISYSHADDRVLERLHKHLAMMQRDALISAWSDHQILPGANLNAAISSELEKADIFLALLSPDYLASNYCYEKEFEFALERSREGALRVVPVIAEPCDWLSSPFQEFLALPKEGKAISEWTNANNAYLDIVTGLRRLVGEASVPLERLEGPGRGEVVSLARKVRVKRDFDVIEKVEFADKTFSSMRDYFRDAASELEGASEDLRSRMEDMSPTAFTCTIVNRAKMPKAEAHITVHNQKARSRGFGGNIEYVFQAYADPGSSNGSIRVDADEYNLYLSTNGYGGYGENSKYSPSQVAEWLWNKFVQQAGIEYE